jgi:hypothetical protein
MSVPSLLSIFGNSGGEDKVYVDDVFSTALYTGNASSNTVPSGLDFTEGSWLSWIKLRNGSDSHFLSDSTQKTGVCFDSFASNRSYGKQTGETTGITAVGTSSYSIQGSNAQVNGNTKTYTSWNFKAAPGFFDVVTWSGSGSDKTISHNLESVPGCIMVKCTSHDGEWYVYHRSLTNATQNFLRLAVNAGSSDQGQDIWGPPSSTTFKADTYLAHSTVGRTYVAYLFAHDEAVFGTAGNESIIKCGGFTGTNTWGNFKVDLGFEPQFVLYKKTSGTSNWTMLDSMRGIAGPGDYPLSDTSTFFSALGASDDAELLANTSSAEGNQGRASLYSQGFLGTTGTSGGVEYIYMAIRRPNKPPTAATEVFAVDTGNSSSTIPCFDSGFPVDFALLKEYNTGANDNFTFSRLTGQRVMRTNTAGIEVNGGGNWIGDSNVGWSKTYNNTNISYMFKRALGFMDVVAYSGFGSNSGTYSNISHNLNVAAQLILVKSRDDVTSLGGAGGWHVYHLGLNKEFLYLNTNGSGGNPFGITGSTSTTFTVRDHPNTGYTGKNYIAYLFGTLSGVSKVGSYSGTGNAINVDCGFTNGARFILIKRSNGSGDWYVWDSVRGIVSGNDPYILLNENATQVTNTDYVDPLSTGFTVTSSAPAALNTSGGTYIFLAIA